jgi:hypothetical protein
MPTSNTQSANAAPARIGPKSRALPVAHWQAWSNAHARAWHNMHAAWRLAPLGAAPATWASLAALQQASTQKLLDEQRACLEEWRDWWNTAQQLPRANTLSKVMEQEFNLALRWVQMAGNRAVNWASLQENLEVNYGHWVQQQAQLPSAQ